MNLLLRLYPRAWRERYGEEFLALLAEHPPTLRGRLDICRGALDARLHYHRRSPMPRKRYICSFCGQRNDAARLIVAGPHSVGICNQCVALCGGGEAEGRAESCSFCGKAAAKAGFLRTSQSGVTICDECVALCVRIIDSEGRGPGGAPDRPGRSRGGRWRTLFRGHHQAEIARP